MRINEIQQLIGSGDYHVEPLAVAEAILRRMAQQRRLLDGELDDGQPACS